MSSSTQNKCLTCGIPASMRVSKWIAEPESWLEELNLSHIRQHIKLEDKIKVLEAENRVLAAEKRVALAQKAVIEEEFSALLMKRQQKEKKGGKSGGKRLGGARAMKKAKKAGEVMEIREEHEKLLGELKVAEKEKKEAEVKKAEVGKPKFLGKPMGRKGWTLKTVRV